MFKYKAYVLFFSFLCHLLNAQVRTPIRTVKPVKEKTSPTYPKTTDLSLGLGVANSALFLARNTKDYNNALGYTAVMMYGGNKPFRASLEYTRYTTINIEPTWYTIRAKSIELNMHTLYHHNATCFYFLSGLSYNVFSGYFTGINDFLNLSSLYDANTKVTTRWLGLNVGVGLEYTFNKIVLFGNYKMRLGRSEGYNDFNIQDVCYSVGLRYNFSAPSIYKLFKGTKGRYFLNTN
jgi:hypothetical protein